MKAATLTADERRRLERLEPRVEAGIGGVEVMIEAGKALAEIRDGQLYRNTAPSWEAYIVGRFRISLRRANQIVGFAGVVEVVQAETGTRVPGLNEKAARPLVGLDAVQLVEAVAEAAADPAGITPATLRKAAAKRKAKASKAPRPVRFRLPGGIVVATLNRKAAKAGVDLERLLEAALEACRRDRAEAA